MATSTPFYDPLKTYQENFDNGPFGSFADKKVFKQNGKPTYTFLGQKLFLPFGIPAGPLLNGKYVKKALDKGFDVAVYKTVRSHAYPCATWPNVLSVKVPGDLTMKRAQEPLIADQEYTQPLGITNSFGVPSFDPDFWQKDMANAVAYAKEGQVVIGSFQGTTNSDGDITKYIKDFGTAAKLVKETGAKILEANLSCPNEGTAHLLCFDLERTNLVVEAIKEEIGDTPLIIKIAYFEDEERLEKLITTLGAKIQAISAINTIPAKIVTAKGDQALPGKGRERSGICGSPIKWAGLEMVKRLKSLREKYDLTYQIVGVGGVMIPDDYNEYRKMGADVVMSATGAIWNPNLAQEIKQL